MTRTGWDQARDPSPAAETLLRTQDLDSISSGPQESPSIPQSLRKVLLTQLERTEEASNWPSLYTTPPERRLGQHSAESHRVWPGKRTPLMAKGCQLFLKGRPVWSVAGVLLHVPRGGSRAGFQGWFPFHFSSIWNIFFWWLRILL